ncbi:hypothetical protein TNIN_84301 [Trichonephila inaurata madagascariensis]|uniref:Uncharacterized protein n=1 Tax=Trichonephila inaurata madagascariensis TaxID=2747483 RepID=A0A8X7C2Y2_9ARAC|nr:hypothetical protein TNIN_84301 [Trichonephila inaurata madagascariensis]
MSWISKVTRYVARKQTRSSYVNRRKNYESPRQAYYRKSSGKSTKYVKKNQDRSVDSGTFGSGKSTNTAKKSTKNIKKVQNNDADSGTSWSGKKSTSTGKKSTKSILGVDSGTLGSGKSTNAAKISTKNIKKDQGNNVDFDSLASGKKITYKGKDTMSATKAFNRIMKPAPRIGQDYIRKPHPCQNLSFTECMVKPWDDLHKNFLDAHISNQFITMFTIVFLSLLIFRPS